MSQCALCHHQNLFGQLTCEKCGSSLSSWGAMLTSEPEPAFIRPLVTIRVVAADGGEEDVFSLRKEEVTVGSSAELLLMDDPFVAHVQARIFFSNTDVVVEDLAGGNGVFAKLRKPSELKASQEVRCGRQRLIFEPLPHLNTSTPRAWGSPDTGYRGRLVQILETGLQGNAFLLQEGDNWIGRDNGDITFPGDGFVSGRHALLQLDSHGRATISDLGSSNGTFLRIDSTSKLEDGDQLLIGRHLLKMAIMTVR